MARLFPRKPVVITEAGWARRATAAACTPTTRCRHCRPSHLRELLAWTKAEGIPCFVFEAFDEAWKGSDDPIEPEKHWGLFTVDRRPKLAVQHLYPDLEAAPGARA